jgi:glutathione peroxidase
MKKILISLLLVLSFSIHAQTLFDINFKTPQGEKFDIKKYQGHVVLVVNIATQCGYTPQLEKLENLYQKYKDKKFVILGVPSNDFGGQNPQDAKDTVAFCKKNYGATYPITEKMVVKGKKRAKLFNHIAKKRDATFDVLWNFEKFLFNKKGELIDSFRSMTDPMDKKLLALIEKELST